MRSMQYGFTPTAIEPGDECKLKVDLRGWFRPSKLMMYGAMKEIRGHYKVKRSRLPLLNRDDVVAYSRVYRCRRGKKVWFRKGRTTVEYRGADRSFVRTYLPSSVVYEDTDPLSYIHLLDLICGSSPQMAGAGVAAEWFGAGNQRSPRYGNGLSLPSTNASVTLLLKNVGDVQVRVNVSFVIHDPF